MDWTGAAPIRSYGFALPDTPAMVVMDTGQKELEYWRFLSNPFLSSPGSGWKMATRTVKSC